MCRQLIQADLVDEYQLRVCPVAIGTGIPLFEPTYRRRNLALTDVKRLAGAVAALTYVPREGVRDPR